MSRHSKHQEPKTVWFDVDGVLLDYLNYFLMRNLHNIKPEYQDIRVSQITEYDMSYLFPGGEEEFVERIYESHTTRDIGYLRPICDVAKVQALHNMGVKLKVITQFAGFAKYKLDRMENLARVFGPVFDEVVFTERGQCKLDILLGREAHYLIEDNPHLLEKYGAVHSRYWPFEVLAIRHPYNVSALTGTDIRSFGFTNEAIDYIIRERL